MWWKPPYICARCDAYIPHDEPVVWVKEPSREWPTRNFFKVPVCMSCVKDDADMWGYFESIVDKRRLELVDCCQCGRLMFAYVPWDKVGQMVCSQACSNRLSKRTVKAYQEYQRWRSDG